MINNSVICAIQISKATAKFNNAIKQVPWNVKKNKTVNDVKYFLYVFNGKIGTGLFNVLNVLVNTYTDKKTYRILLFDKKTGCYYYYGKMTNVFNPSIASTNSISFKIAYTK